jgi:hypothetical protein
LKNSILKNSNLKLGLESLESRKLCAVDLAAGLPFVCFADHIHTGDVSAFAMISSAIGETRRLHADVDGDGRVSPIDALRVIDALNRVGTSRPVGGGEGEQEPIGSLDTNNDGSLNPIDVLVVIDALNGDASLAATAFEGFEATSFEEFEATAYETDVVFEEYDTEFDFSWVKRGGINDEFPLFLDERFELFALEGFSEEFSEEFSKELDAMFTDMFNEEFSEFAELYPIYATMGVGSTGGMNVAMFSQNGPLGHVMRKNMLENAELEPAVVSYFSSNFLRGSAR